jgi:hypothetical protein
MWICGSCVSILLVCLMHSLELRELKARSTLLGACTNCPMLGSELEASVIEIKDLHHKLDHSSRLFYPLCVKHLSQVEESATKSTYKLSVRFERCEHKGEKSAHKFIPSSNYHKEEEALRPSKTHYPSNPKPSFNPKREVKRESPKPREDEFCFCRKKIEKRCFEYARNSYPDEFFEFLPRSYSRASPHTSSRALHQFSHVPNPHSYGFGSRENLFMPRRFGYSPCPHRGDHFLHMPSFFC